MRSKVIHIIACWDCPRVRRPRDAFEDYYCSHLHRFIDRGIIPGDCPLPDDIEVRT